MDKPLGRDSQTYAIIGAAMDVHRVLGGGYLEAVYHDALAVEFQLRQVPFERQVPQAIWYKGVRLAASYRADFICFGAVLVELKALPVLTSREDAQVINYLKTTGLSRALLLNFGRRRLDYQRFALSSLAADDSDGHGAPVHGGVWTHDSS